MGGYRYRSCFLWELADSPIGCKRAIICSNYSFSSLLWPLFVLPNASTLELLFISKCYPYQFQAINHALGLHKGGFWWCHRNGKGQRHGLTHEILWLKKGWMAECLNSNSNSSNNNNNNIAMVWPMGMESQQQPTWKTFVTMLETILYILPCLFVNFASLFHPAFIFSPRRTKSVAY